MEQLWKRVLASFRDPSGFLFRVGGALYRQVNMEYQANYDHLMDSGLHDALVQEGLLIPHREVDIPAPRPDHMYKVIQPALVEFISYPYEWCFSQLKDAALTTLEIQRRAMGCGMSLKDCSAYNIQFHQGKCLLIDTLSFEKYKEGKPWVAFRQFCQHFLSPLALMTYRDVRLSQLLKVYLDGIPLDLTSKLLPFRSRLSFSLLSHIHLHAKLQKRFARQRTPPKDRGFSQRAFYGLIENLAASIRKMTWTPTGTEWESYYEDTNYTSAALEHKKALLTKFLADIRPALLLDFGGNTGLFARMAADNGIFSVCCDMDAAAVEKNYVQARNNGESRILPLVVDLTDPSPSIGWANQERMSFLRRVRGGTILALALIHHLAISDNVPLDRLARFFSNICNDLLVEFVPREDSQVQRLLSTREDIFTDYTQDSFEVAFTRHFAIRRAENLLHSHRTLYFMTRRAKTE